MTMADNFLFFVLVLLALGFTTLGLIYRHAILYILAAAAWGLNIVYVVTDVNIGFAGTGLPLAMFFAFCMLAMIASMVWLRKPKENIEVKPTLSHREQLDERLNRIREIRNKGRYDF